MAEIKLKNIIKRWGDFYGARNINLTIKDNEFLVLLGPSGCGKTTTMRMISGLEEPTSGEIWIGDQMVNDLEPKDRDIAMVFQSYGLYPHLSTFENIRFPLKMRKIPEDEHQDKVMAAARMVEMENFLDRKPRELSGGQRQRVALARAIVRNPNCFLMDEPLSNLDAKLRVTMRAELKYLQHKLEVTTVFVTHDQVEAMTIAHRVAVMNKGVICQLGTPQEIYNEPQDTFVAGFIGSPAMNLIDGKVSNGNFINENSNMKLKVPAKIINKIKGNKLTVGVRAEELVPSKEGPNTIRANIYSIELLGDATLISIKEGKNIISCKVFGQEIANRYKIGDNISLAFKPQSMFYFNSQDGARIN